MSPTSSITTSALAALPPSALLPGDRRPPDDRRPDRPSRQTARPPTPRPTTPSASTSRWSRSRHGGFANAYLADVGTSRSRRSAMSSCSRWSPPEGRRPTRVHAERASRAASTAPTSRTARHSAPASRPWKALYGFEDNGTDRCRLWPPSCTRTRTLTVWTCHLRDGVTFHDGATFEAKDVLVSFAAQWDAASADCTSAQHRCVRVLARPVGRLPEPARTVRHRGSAACAE